MFEDLHRTHAVRLANTKRSKLHFLLQHHANYGVVDELEERSGRKFSSEKRHQLLRRLQEEFKKRPRQDETYEQWHFERKPPRDSGGAEKKRRKVKTSVILDDFDEQVKQTILQELANEEEENTETPASHRSSTQPSSQGRSDSDSDTDYSTSASEPQPDNEDADHPEWDEETHPDSLYALKKLRQWSSGFDTLKNWARDRYQLKVWGLESVGNSDEIADASIMRQHLRSLTTLLHLNILRRKWDVAYKVVCLVVRFDVDLRALWPLALEILVRRKEEMRKSGSILRLGLLKEQQFLEWLTLAFPISHNPSHSARSLLGPVYRSATRTHAPIYVITFLWELLVEQNYTKLRDTIEDLILQPPYSTDGVFYFILAMCNIAEAIHLVSCYLNFDATAGTVAENEDIGDLAEDMMLIGSKDTIHARILNNVNSAKASLASCGKLNFEYPEELIRCELLEILSVMKGKTTFRVRDVDNTSHERAKYIFKDSQVSIGSGSNALSGKHLKKLIADVGKEKTTPNSWIWRWIRSDGKDPDICICDFCGQLVLKTRASTKKIANHLALHNIDKTTTVRISDTRMKQYEETMKEMLSSQDKPALDHTRGTTYRFGFQLTRSDEPVRYTPIRHTHTQNAQNAQNAQKTSEAEVANQGINTNFSEGVSAKSVSKKTTSKKANSKQVNAKNDNSKKSISKKAGPKQTSTKKANTTEVSSEKAIADPSNGLVQTNADEPASNGNTYEAALADSFGAIPSDSGVENFSLPHNDTFPEDYGPSEGEVSLSKSPKVVDRNETDENGHLESLLPPASLEPDDEHMMTTDSPIEEAELEIFKELEQAYSQSDASNSIRRYESFSPNTTMDTQEDGNISLAFQQYATQTQEIESGKHPESSNVLPSTIAKISLNSFSQDQTSLEMSTIDHKDDSDEHSDHQDIKTEELEGIDEYPMNHGSDEIDKNLEVSNSNDGDKDGNNVDGEKEEIVNNADNSESLQKFSQAEDIQPDQSTDTIEVKYEDSLEILDGPDDISSFEDSANDVYDDAQDRFDTPSESLESDDYYEEHNEKVGKKNKLEMDFDFDFD